jgi:outer membrane protein OmpA-like peptidoglycan-associated protein
MQKIIAFSFAVLFSSLIPAQEQEINYVPNPSFEKAQNLPNIWSRKVSKFNNAIAPWNSPTTTIPDIISLLVNERFWANPLNRKQSSGKQLPRTGNNMIGIRTFGEGDDGAVACWHEYIQTKLTKELEIGKEYYVELWVSDAVRGIRSSNNIGVYFSDKPLNTNIRLPIYKTPHINKCKIIENTDWYKISGFYKPDSVKKYIIIGNFYHDAQTNVIKKDGMIQGAYYYIDDIKVRPKKGGDVATGCKPIPVIIPTEQKPIEEDKPDITTTEQQLNEIEYNIGETIKLDNIFFETDKSKLKTESLVELNKLLEMLNKYPNLKIEINGHTDNVGTDEYNLKLSKSRAKAVVDYLIEKSIAETRLTHNGYGSTKPIKTNKTEEGRAQNRRVEFKVVGK